MNDLNHKLAEALGWTVEDDMFVIGEEFEAPLDDLSTDWHCAGLVVEAMRERGWQFEISTHDTSGDQFCCTLFYDDIAGCGAWAPTAPEVIAKAALAALQQKVTG